MPREDAALCTGNAMARPKLQTPRDRQLNIGLTAAEHETVLRRAAAEGMRPVDYGRARLLGGRLRQKQASKEGGRFDPLFLIQLSRIGNNLNQIARQIHSLRLPLPVGLEEVIRELRELLRQGTRT